MTSEPLFGRVALIGIGLIGSSLARAIAQHGLAGDIVIFDASVEARAAAAELKLGQVSETLAGAVTNADLVIIATFTQFDVVPDGYAPVVVRVDEQNHAVGAEPETAGPATPKP